jgi:hypothetical protein
MATRNMISRKQYINFFIVTFKLKALKESLPTVMAK